VSNPTVEKKGRIAASHVISVPTLVQDWTWSDAKRTADASVASGWQYSKRLPTTANDPKATVANGRFPEI
jgi:hypothetical protein